MSYANALKTGASAPPPAPPAAAAATSTTKYGIHGNFVRVNVPSYNTGNGCAIKKVAALLVVDLGRKHLVLTSALGSEMLFHIHQNRDDVEMIPNETRLSKDQCVQRLQEFIHSKPNIDVCLVRQPFMDTIATMDHTVPDTIEFNGYHQAICLYNNNDDDQQPTP